ncbi:MAG TPA: glycosyltransferase [Candidatus Obscuribacterales bacterium]
MKIALVHDYLTQRGGAERVFELICRRFPDADIYTSIYAPGHTIDLGDRPVKTTFLQAIPKSAKYFRLLAPLYYPAFRTLNLQGYDLIISSTSSFAKAVRKSKGAYHICLCHNITRFLWDTQTYLKEYRDFKAFSPVIKTIFQLMRKTDIRYAQEPNLYIANSSTVARRVESIYKKPAIVINYPIDDRRFTFSAQKDNFYLASARLLGYKRIDVIVEAFNQLGWPLLITGDGPERSHLEAMAADNVTFLGYVSDEERCRLMSRAKGVILAALEDYGLVPIEANFSGTPVVAYGAGGVLDTQVPGTTGLFFDQQTPESLIATLLKFQDMSWDYEAIRDHAVQRFTEAVFFQRVEQAIQDVCGVQSLALAS